MMQAHKVLNVAEEKVEEETTENFMQKIFECMRAITETKEDVDLDDEWLEKAIYILVKAISYYPECIGPCNDVNKMSKFSPRIRYDFLMKSIPPYKRVKRKWPKKIEDDRLPLIQKYYNYNRLRANEVLSVLTEEQINSILHKMNNLGGVMNE